MKIIYENKQLLVVEKAAGEAVQSANIRVKDLTDELRSYLAAGQTGNASGQPYLGIVHRLDQPVQGLLVFAKTKQAAGDLSAQAADGGMRKWYAARLRREAGAPPLDKSGTLRCRMDKDPKTNRARILPEGAAGGKLASLSYRMLTEDTALICLETGRFHQIRAQFAHAGHPLMGDRKYGSADGLQYPCLCACRLQFTDPVTKKQLVFSIDPSRISFLDEAAREALAGASFS